MLGEDWVTGAHQAGLKLQQGSNQAHNGVKFTRGKIEQVHEISFRSNHEPYSSAY
jgi:hypothetical protein